MSLNLSDLLNDSKVKNCNLWEEVGLELGIEYSTLEVIAKDHPDDTVRRKTKMLDTWLNNCEDQKKEHLHQAIDRVNERYQREEHRRRTKDEEEKALAAVDQVRRLLQEWEERNKEIANNNKSFQEELKKEELWLSHATKWEQEEDEWQQGEDGTRRKNLEEALEDGNFKTSLFVQDFFRRKNIKISDLSDKGVEGLLRQGLMEIENSRTTTLLTRLREMKEHHKRLQHLQQEIVESNKLIDKRLQAYVKIKQGLEEVGVTESKIAELNEQLRNLKHTAEEYKQARKHIGKIYEKEQNNLNIWEVKMHIHIESFGDLIKKMKEKQSDFLVGPFAVIGTASGAVTRAIGGAEVGTAVAPVVGTVIGALVGVFVGSIVGLVGKELHDQIRRQMQNEAQKYKETLLHAEKIQKKFQDLLD